MTRLTLPRGLDLEGAFADRCFARPRGRPHGWRRSLFKTALMRWPSAERPVEY